MSRFGSGFTCLSRYWARCWLNPQFSDGSKKVTVCLVLLRAAVTPSKIFIDLSENCTLKPHILFSFFFLLKFLILNILYGKQILLIFKCTTSFYRCSQMITTIKVTNTSITTYVMHDSPKFVHFVTDSLFLIIFNFPLIPIPNK